MMATKQKLSIEVMVVFIHILCLSLIIAFSTLLDNFLRDHGVDYRVSDYFNSSGCWFVSREAVKKHVNGCYHPEILVMRVLF